MIPGREEVWVDLRPRRRDTDDISDFDLNGDDRLGRAFDAKGNFSPRVDRKIEQAKERRARRESVGPWLEGVEEEAVNQMMRQCRADEGKN